MSDSSAWTEADSRQFLDLADVAVPGRREQQEVLLSLIPAAPSDAFLVADLGCGGGLLLEQVLERFPASRAAGYDGSETMRAAAAERLARFGGRATLYAFDLADNGWTSALGSGLRCVISSLCLHHADDAGKQRAFREIHDGLEPGGALIIADVIEPATVIAHRAADSAWDRATREQSLALTGSLDAYERAVSEGWSPHADAPPEPGEMPARIFEQLKWLEQAGFPDPDVFWMRAGIAIFGGYR
jgi:SAM-dependent methyltransferase